MADPLDYLTQLKSQAQNQLFSLDPSLRKYQQPQISQDEYDKALAPVADKALQIGLGAGGLMTAPPALAFSGVAASIADAILGNKGGDVVGAPGEAGMNSLDIPTLLKMAQSDTDRALAGPTIHDVINSRNELYHATQLRNQWGIQNTGEIAPGGQYNGVSMSRVPEITGIRGAVRYAVDPSAVQTVPLAEKAYGKMTPKAMPGFFETLSHMTETNGEKKTLSTLISDLNAQEDTAAAKTLSEQGMKGATKHFASIMDTPAFKNALEETVDKKMNPDFEFENRTQNKQSINIAKAVNRVLISGSPSETSEALKQNFDSNYPLPFELISQQNLPASRITRNIALSRQVVGQ